MVSKATHKVLGTKLSTPWNCHFSWYINPWNHWRVSPYLLWDVKPTHFKHNTSEIIFKYDKKNPTRHQEMTSRVKSSKILGPMDIVSGPFLEASLLNVQLEIIAATHVPSIGPFRDGRYWEMWRPVGWCSPEYKEDSPLIYIVSYIVIYNMIYIYIMYLCLCITMLWFQRWLLECLPWKLGENDRIWRAPCFK